MTPRTRSPRRNPRHRGPIRGRIFELVAISVTAAGKFIFGGILNLDLFYVVFACVFWTGYVLLRSRWEPHVLFRWGFTRHGIIPGMRMVAPVGIAMIGGFIAYGIATGEANPNWNTVILLIAYPLWGTVQQFMVVALLADNVAALSGERVPEWAAVILAAGLFALVHIPEYTLAAAVFFLGLITTSVFFRTRSIWVPGVFHGWYATVFYVFVLGQDPLGSLLSGTF